MQCYRVVAVGYILLIVNVIMLALCQYCPMRALLSYNVVIVLKNSIFGSFYHEGVFGVSTSNTSASMSHPRLPKLLRYRGEGSSSTSVTDMWRSA